MRTNATYYGYTLVEPELIRYLIRSDANGNTRLQLRHDIRGYARMPNWGGRDHEAAQCALAILADFFGDARKADAWHLRFKDEVLPLHPRNEDLVIAGSEIAQWVGRVEKELAESRQREAFEATVGERWDGQS